MKSPIYVNGDFMISLYHYEGEPPYLEFSSRGSLTTSAAVWLCRNINPQELEFLAASFNGAAQILRGDTQ